MTDLILAPVYNPPSADVRHYVENALSDNTRKAYGNDLAHYRTWGRDNPCGTRCYRRLFDCPCWYPCNLHPTTATCFHRQGAHDAGLS